MAQTINTSVTRTDAPRKVTGTATYAADVMPAGMLHGAMATSAIAVGTLSAIDTSRAEAEPGVIAVFTHENLPDYKPVKGFYPAGRALPVSGRWRAPGFNMPGNPSPMSWPKRRRRHGAARN